MSSFVSNSVNTNNEFNQALSKQKGSALDKDAFLLLLVTQFKYQDPLNPMEDKDFIAQLSQFSSLEQLMNLNDSMQGLTAANKNQEMINATSYIGKKVDASGNSVSKVTDTETGKVGISTFRYAIGETSAKAQVNVFDSDNNMINSYTLPAQTAGTYPFTWDGKSYFGDAPDGVYRIVPVFYNAEGNTIPFDQVVDGRVTSVLTDNGITYLTLDDGRTISLANVRRVAEDTKQDGSGSGSGDGSGGDTGGDTGGGSGDGSGSGEETPTAKVASK